MIGGLFNCGGGAGEYVDDFDDSLYGDYSPDDITLARQYRGRDEKATYDDDNGNLSFTSDKDREILPPPELGTNLHALAMKRLSSRRVTVAVANNGGRLSHRNKAVLKHKQHQQQHHRRGQGYYHHQEEEPHIVTQLHTIRRPRSFIAQKHEQKENHHSPSTAAHSHSTHTHTSGIPKEICIEIDPTDERDPIAEEREEGNRDPPPPPPPPVDQWRDTSPPPPSVEPWRDTTTTTTTNRSTSTCNNKRSADSNNTSTAPRDCRPPLPTAAKCKHIRIRIRKPLGIVFESLNQDSGVRISELLLSGNAARCGKLEVWDELVSINGKSMKRRSFDQVMDKFARCDPSEKVELVFRRRNAYVHRSVPEDKYGMD